MRPSMNSKFPNVQRDRRDEAATQRPPGALEPYKATCDREPLNSRLGPGGFNPPYRDHPEESWNKEFINSGFKSHIPGIDEKNEFLSLTDGNKWNSSDVTYYRGAIVEGLKSLKHVHMSKRKSGQVYGVPFSGDLLTKSGIFPDQRNVDENFRRKWIEDLSGRKRLRSFSQFIPHGFRRQTLFDALFECNAPIYRATWFIKSLLLNQFRSQSQGFDPESQQKRMESWTADLMEFGKAILDEMSSAHIQSAIGSLPNPGQFNSREGAVVVSRRWSFFMRIVMWHLDEGLLDPSRVMEKAVELLQNDVVKPEQGSSVVVLDAVTVFCVRLQPYFARFPSSLLDLISICREKARAVRSRSSQNSQSSQRSNLSMKFASNQSKTGNAKQALSDEPSSPLFLCLLKLLKFLEACADKNKASVNFLKRPSPSFSKSGAPETLQPSALSVEAAVPVAHQIQTSKWECFRSERKFVGLVAAVNQSALQLSHVTVLQTLRECLFWGKAAEGCKVIFGTAFQSEDSAGCNLVTSKAESRNDAFGVRFICDWAVSERDNGSLFPAAGSLAVLRKIYFAVSVLRLRNIDLVRKLGELPKPETEPMHFHIRNWLRERQNSSPQVEEALAVLLTELAEDGLFSPVKFEEWQIATGFSALRSAPDLSCQKSYLEEGKLGFEWNWQSSSEAVVAYSKSEAVDWDKLPNKRKVDMIWFQEIKDGAASWILNGMATKRTKLDLESRFSPSQYSQHADSGLGSSGTQSFSKNALIFVSISLSKMLNLPMDFGVLSRANVIEPLVPECKICAADKKTSSSLAESSFMNYDDSLEEMDSSDGWLTSNIIAEVVSVEDDRAAMEEPANAQQLAENVSSMDTVCPHQSSFEREPFHDSLKELKGSVLSLKLQERIQLAKWLCATVIALVTSFKSTDSRDGSFVKVIRPACGQKYAWKFTDYHLSWVVLCLDMCGQRKMILKLLMELAPVVFCDDKQRESRDGFVLGECCVSEGLLLHCLKRYEPIVASASFVGEVLRCVTSAWRSSKPSDSGESPREKLIIFLLQFCNRFKENRDVISWAKNMKMGALGAQFPQDFSKARSVLDSMSSLFKTAEKGSEGQEAASSRVWEAVQKHLNPFLKQVINFPRSNPAVFGISGLCGLDSQLTAAAVSTGSGIMDSVRPARSKDARNVVSDSSTSAVADVLLNSVVDACFGAFERLLSAKNQFLAAHDDAESSEGRKQGSLGFDSVWAIIDVHAQCLLECKKLHPGKRGQLENLFLVQAKNAVEQALIHPSNAKKRSRFSFKFSPETPDVVPAAAEMDEDSFFEEISAEFFSSDPVATIVASLVISAVSKGVILWEKALYLATGEGNETVRSFWFRALMGNSNTFLGHTVEPRCQLALLRLQRTLPLPGILKTAFPAFIRALESSKSAADLPPGSAVSAGLDCVSISREVLSHEPLREILLENTDLLYKSLCSMLKSPDFLLAGTVSSIAEDSARHDLLIDSPRLFVQSILERKLPEQPQPSSRMSSEAAMANVVRILDELQPHTFHWQWLLIRFILNEQSVEEKRGRQTMKTWVDMFYDSNDDAARARELSEWEKNFVQAVETRLLLRPDFAVGYSQLITVLGRGGSKGSAMESWLVKIMGWFLQGGCSLTADKSVRQQLERLVKTGNLSLDFARVQKCASSADCRLFPSAEVSDQEMDASEGGSAPENADDELMEDRKTPDCSKSGERGGSGVPAEETCPSESQTGQKRLKRNMKGGRDCLQSGEDCEKAGSQQTGPKLAAFTLERSCADLVLPCLLRADEVTKQSFDFDLVSQFRLLDEKLRPSAANGKPGLPGFPSKKRGMASGFKSNADSSGPGADSATVQATLWLLVQFLLPRLPAICESRDPNHAEWRVSLAQALISLLCLRSVQEGSLPPVNPKAGVEEAFLVAREAELAAGESLFERLLLILKALLSPKTADWLKLRVKDSDSGPRLGLPLSRDALRSLQATLDRMAVTEPIRARIQSAIPMAIPTANTVKVKAVKSLQLPMEGLASPRPADRTESDVWTLLEEAATGAVEKNKVHHLLRGSVRVQKRSLTYSCAMEE